MPLRKSDFPTLPCWNCPYRLPDAEGCCEDCRDFCDFFWAMKWVRCSLRRRKEVCRRCECIHDSPPPGPVKTKRGGDVHEL